MLQSLDLTNYLRSLILACPNGWEVTIADETQVLITTNILHSKPVLAITQEKLDLVEKPNVDHDFIRKQVVIDGAEHQVVLLSLNSHAHQLAGWLVLHAEMSVSTAPNLALIKLLADFLSREAILNEELNSMAVELSERYEELNLVYSTSEKIDADVCDDQLIKMILENVVDYLDAEFSLLVIPEKNIWRLHGKDNVLMQSIEASIRKPEAMIFNWLEKNRQPLIVNEPQDIEEHIAAELLPYRSLTAPLYDIENKTIGYFSMFRKYTQPRITNSDKNLVATMADKIAQVIHINYDFVTGLPKQGKFHRQIATAHSQMAENKNHSLLQVNVPEMQFIVEHHGAKVAERVNKEISKALQEMGRDTDLYAKLDDGDLGVLMLNCDVEVAARKANELCEAVKARPLVFREQQIGYSVAVGIAEIGQTNGFNPIQPLAHAAIAGRIASENLESSVKIFSLNDDVVLQQKSTAQVVANLHNALAKDGFSLFAQSISPLCSTDTAPHFEILLRLFDKDDSLISPFHFIPIAERHGLMTQIDLWVVNNTLRQLHDSRIIETHPGTVCSVNLSGQSLSSESFLVQIADLVTKSKISTTNICFEITETAAIQDLNIARAFITRLRKLGCKFALDDFGAGLSSFTYLRTLPLDYVKIDGSFVKDILTDNVAETMVRSIHEVGQVMGLETVAEFVENQEISNKLLEIGVHYGQGYGIDKPSPLSGYLEAVISKESWHTEEKSSG